ncbi:hypothetical protein QTP88_006854 [Uroleucon formosanum]
MSFTCVKCFDTSTHNVDILECSTCKKFLYFYCVGYFETNLKNMLNNTKARFQCTECQINIHKSQKSPKNQKTENKVNLVDSMENNIKELMNSVSFMSSQFDNLINKIDTIVSELKNIKLVNEKITVENKQLSDEVCILKSKIGKIINMELKATTVDFLKSHDELSKGKHSSTFTQNIAKQQWEELSGVLNSIPGPIKDWKSRRWLYISLYEISQGCTMRVTTVMLYRSGLKRDSKTQFFLMFLYRHDPKVFINVFSLGEGQT